MGRLLAVVGVGLAVLGAAGAALAQAPEGLSVLVLEADRPELPVYVEANEAFRAGVREASRQPVDVFIESLDLSRFNREGYWAELEAWLGTKYRGRQLQAIVAMGPVAYRAAALWRDRLWPGVPIVFGAVDRATLQALGRVADSTGSLIDFGHLDTVRLALELLPDTRRLVIVGGAPDRDPHVRFFGEEIKAAFGDRLEIVDLAGLPIGEILDRTRELPEGSIILVTAFSTDGAGRTFTGHEVCALLDAEASAPVFGFIRTYLGSGIVGGVLFDPAAVGREVAALTTRVLDGEQTSSIAIEQSGATAIAFDSRSLDRWGIPENRLPPGSVVEFRSQSAWRQHRLAVLGALTVIGLQAASIVALLRSRGRRRRINRELHRLSGQLITAQEDERRRVARELHDDVSQRLALLAIELESSGAAPIDRLSAATSKVQEIARDVHSLAHDLQPPRLDAMSLTTEIEGFCAEVEARQDVAIDFRAPVRPMAVPPDAALALYRVAQEAVQNAVKHSGADQIMVELATSPRWASITVSDNGRGFQKDDARMGRGLGLAGMEERARLVGGWLDVDSEPGSGAVVSAWVPIRAPERVEEADGPTAGPDR